MKSKISPLKNGQFPVFMAGMAINAGQYSCQKRKSPGHAERHFKNYSVLVTWTGTPDNLVSHMTPANTDVAQSIVVAFDGTKQDTTACCVQNKRKNYSEGLVGFGDAGLLSDDSLWVITDGEEGIDTLHISAHNGEKLDYSDYYYSGPEGRVVPPEGSVRIGVFPFDRQSLLLDTTIHIIKTVPSCTKDSYFRHFFI